MNYRMGRFFQKDGKSIVMAFDHGGGGRIVVDDPGRVIAQAVEGGVDGILTTYGVMKNFNRELGHVGRFLRIDHSGSADSPRSAPNNGLNFIPTARWDIEDALRIGADGIMCMGYTKCEVDPESMRVVADVVAACDRWGLVSAAEMLPNGFSPDPADRTVDAMKVSCRVACELGIDVIKTAFVPPVEEFKQVVANSYVPFLALGGPVNDDDRITLEHVKGAMEAGCSGIAMGRNIWNHKNIPGLVSALSKIVHENASVDAALKELS